jgi:hypothetical protein
MGILTWRAPSCAAQAMVKISTWREQVGYYDFFEVCGLLLH